MKTLTLLLLCFCTIQSNGQDKMPNFLERRPIKFSIVTHPFEYMMQDSKTGKIHWIMKNGKDSVITNKSAKIKAAKWRYDAIPKRLL